MAVTLASQLANRATRRAIRKWKFALHESYMTATSLPTLGAGNRVRWLHKARGRRVELILNKPGSVSFNVPANSSEGDDIFGYELIRCIVAYAEDKSGTFQPIWSGPIYTAEASEPDGKISVTCVGWEELLEHRELRTDVNFLKVTNGELAQMIVNTANNQYANDGYGLGGVAEDLLYGAGDFEDSGTWDLATTQTWTSVGQVGIGDFPLMGSGITPNSIAGWQDCPPSGSHWFRTRIVKTSTGAGIITKAVYIKSRQGITINRGVVSTPENPAPSVNSSGFAIEPSQTYTVSGVYRGTQRSFGNGISISGLSAANQVSVGIGMSWHDAQGYWINSTENTLLTNQSSQAWSAGTTFTQTFTAPQNAAYAGVYIFVNYGNGAVNTVDMLWDNIICTKASDPGRRNFPLRGNLDDPYLINQMSDASMETGSQWSAWALYPPGDPTISRTQSAEWNSSGTNSLKFRYGLVASSGETGLRYTWINGPGTLGTGNPFYFRARIKIVANGSNGTQARFSLQDASGVIGYQSLTPLITGPKEDTLEIYIPSVPSVPGYNRMVLEVFTNALAGDFVMWYIDDVTLAEEDPPVPFYEGSQQSARYYDMDAFARGMRSIGPVFTRTYSQGTKLAQILREMTEIEWGVDYDVHPLTRKLRIYWDQLIPNTSLRGKGQDHPDVVFGYGLAPNNVARITEAHDASRLKNRVNTQGKAGRGLAQDFDSINRYGLHEETIPMTDVADPPPPQPSILAVYAGAEVAMFSKPFQLFTFQPKKYVAGESVPMFGVDYGLGDLTRLRARKNVIKIGVSGEDKDDIPQKTTLIDDFNRTNGANVEAGAGAAIWSAFNYVGAANQFKTATTFGTDIVGQPKAAGNSSMRLLGLWGPDWDFVIDTYNTNTGSTHDIFWGSTLSVGGVMGTDYHRIRIDPAGNIPPSGGYLGDRINVDGVDIIKDLPVFVSRRFIWISKRGTNYRVFEKNYNNDPWQRMATFTIPAIAGDSVPHYIGFGASNTSSNFNSITGGTYVDPSLALGNSGQVMRVFGAAINIDDNNDGETIESLTTALSA